MCLCVKRVCMCGGVGVGVEGKTLIIRYNKIKIPSVRYFTASVLRLYLP